MVQKKLEAGETIYREGDSADVAYIVTSGKVELLDIRDGREVQISVITEGGTFGELAVFDPSILRSLSAHTLEPTTVETMTSEEFQEQFVKVPKVIQPFLQLAFDKMKAVKTRARASISNAVRDNAISTITVTGATDEMRKLFKTVEVPVARLPFRIGGYPEGGEVSRRDQLHLSLPVQDNPLRVSRQHCEVTIENGGVVLLDIGSRFCTTVNDTVIGRGRGAYIAPLKKGANAVTLGAADGPYKLTVTCA